MEKENEIHALIQLLDDNDREVFKHVHDKLLSMGPEVIPVLEQAWSHQIDPVTHERLEEIIHEIQFDTLITDWKAWLQKETPDLLTGAFLVSKYHYPELKYEDVLRKVMKVKQNIWLELSYNQTPLEQVQVFNQVFYNYHNFNGAQVSNDYNDFCINQLLETNKGNAIALGILYQIVANELNIPIYGVTLQKHFILACCKRTIIDFNDPLLERDIMFYINPINKGSIFSRNEIKDYLEKMDAPHDISNYVPSDPIGIVRELLRNLAELHEIKNNTDRVKDIHYLLELMEGE